MIEAKTFMTEEVITISEDASLEEAARMMLRKHTHLLLVTKNNIPIAIVTKKEMLKVALKKKAASIRVKDVMSNEFILVGADTPYKKIDQMFRKNPSLNCPVIEDNKLIGVITQPDVINTERDFTRVQRIRQDVTLIVFGLLTAIFIFLYSPWGQLILGIS